MTNSLQRLARWCRKDMRRTGVVTAAFTLGLLFWARLIVVSDLPRTAVADPEPPALVPENGAAADAPTGRSESDDATVADRASALAG